VVFVAMLDLSCRPDVASAACTAGRRSAPATPKRAASVTGSTPIGFFITLGGQKLNRS
jgi:hypothetical protein